MNDKTGNFIGYSQAVGILQGNATTTTTANWNGATHTYGDGIWATPLNGGNRLTVTNGSDHTSLSTLITNQNNMTKQVKVAVFTVERNDKNEVISSKFIEELWVEQKNGSSIELAVAKFLEPDFDPEAVVIKILYTALF